MGEIRVEQAALRFRDETMRPPFEAKVDDISVSVAHLSNAPGVEATVEAALRASPGGRLAGRGRFSLAPLASSGTISLEGFEPAAFAPYTQDQVAFEVAKGRLDLGARYELADKRDHVALRLRDGFVEAQDLALRQPRTRNEIVRAPQLAVRGVDADLEAGGRSPSPRSAPGMGACASRATSAASSISRRCSSARRPSSATKRRLRPGRSTWLTWRSPGGASVSTIAP